MQLVTHQTGPEGRKVARLLVEEGLDIERELYLGLVLDRAAGCPVMMASATGGMDIEQVAIKKPNKIITAHNNMKICAIVTKNIFTPLTPFIIDDLINSTKK